MDLGLRNKVIMVAAASAGLGYAIARAVAQEGAAVSLCSRDVGRSAEAAARLRDETGSEVLGVPCDVSDPAAIDGWVAATVERFGGVDGLVTNTGGPPAGAFMQFTDADWQRAFDGMLLSAVRLTRAVIPHMQARGGGSILMLTSLTVKEPADPLILSGVMRAGVTALAKNLSRALGPDGIRVNTLMPGRIATERLAYLDGVVAERQGITVEAQQARMVAQIPLGRYGEPAEFARAAAFLLSPAASYLTGVTLAVDGGMVHTVW